MKACSNPNCTEPNPQPLDNFYLRRGKHLAQCKRCNINKRIEWRKIPKNRKRENEAKNKRNKLNPEKNRATYKKWRLNNLEKARAKNRLWIRNNPEKARAAYKRWVNKNPDDARRAWREAAKKHYYKNKLNQ